MAQPRERGGDDAASPAARQLARARWRGLAGLRQLPRRKRPVPGLVVQAAELLRKTRRVTRRGSLDSASPHLRTLLASSSDEDSSDASCVSEPATAHEQRMRSMELGLAGEGAHIRTWKPDARNFSVGLLQVLGEGDGLRRVEAAFHEAEQAKRRTDGGAAGQGITVADFVNIVFAVVRHGSAPPAAEAAAGPPPARPAAQSQAYRLNFIHDVESTLVREWDHISRLRCSPMHSVDYFATDRMLKWALADLFCTVDANDRSTITWYDLQAFLTDVLMHVKTARESDGRIRKYSHTTTEAAGLEGIVRVAKFKRCGKLAVVSTDNTCLLVNHTTLAAVKAYPVEPRHGRILDVAAMDGRQWERLACSTSDGRVRVYHATMTALVDELHLGTSQTVVNWHAAQEHAPFLCLGSRQGRVSLAGLRETGSDLKQPESFTPHQSAVTASLFTSDGVLVTSALEPRIVLSSPETLQTISVLEGHRGSVFALGHAALSNFMASSGLEPHPILWVPNSSSYKSLVLRDADPHGARIVKLHFVPDTPQLLSMDLKGCVKVWDVRTLSVVQTLPCSADLANHRLTPASLERYHDFVVDDERRIVLTSGGHRPPTADERRTRTLRIPRARVGGGGGGDPAQPARAGGRPPAARHVFSVLRYQAMPKCTHPYTAEAYAVAAVGFLRDPRNGARAAAAPCPVFSADSGRFDGNFSFDESIVAHRPPDPLFSQQNNRQEDALRREKSGSRSPGDAETTHGGNIEAIVTCAGRRVTLWDPRNGDRVRVVCTCPEEIVQFAAEAPAERWILVGLSDHTIVAYTLPAGVPTARLRAHRAPITAIVHLRGLDQFVSTDASGLATVMDLPPAATSSPSLDRLCEPAHARLPAALGEPGAEACVAAYDEASAVLLLGQKGNGVCVWTWERRPPATDEARLEQLRAGRRRDPVVWSVLGRCAGSPAAGVVQSFAFVGESLFVAADSLGGLHLWDTAGALVMRWVHHSARARYTPFATGAVFEPRHRFLYVCDSHGLASAYDLSACLAYARSRRETRSTARTEPPTSPDGYSPSSKGSAGENPQRRFATAADGVLWYKPMPFLRTPGEDATEELPRACGGRPRAPPLVCRWRAHAKAATAVHLLDGPVVCLVTAGADCNVCFWSLWGRGVGRLVRRRRRAPDKRAHSPFAFLPSAPEDTHARLLRAPETYPFSPPPEMLKRAPPSPKPAADSLAAPLPPKTLVERLPFTSGPLAGHLEGLLYPVVGDPAEPAAPPAVQPAAQQHDDADAHPSLGAAMPRRGSGGKGKQQTRVTFASGRSSEGAAPSGEGLVWGQGILFECGEQWASEPTDDQMNDQTNDRANDTQTNGNADTQTDGFPCGGGEGCEEGRFPTVPYDDVPPPWGPAAFGPDFGIAAAYDLHYKELPPADAVASNDDASEPPDCAGAMRRAAKRGSTAPRPAAGTLPKARFRRRKDPRGAAGGASLPLAAARAEAEKPPCGVGAVAAVAAAVAVAAGASPGTWQEAREGCCAAALASFSEGPAAGWRRTERPPSLRRLASTTPVWARDDSAALRAHLRAMGKEDYVFSRPPSPAPVRSPPHGEPSYLLLAPEPLPEPGRVLSQLYCGNRTSNPDQANTATSKPGGGGCGVLEKQTDGRQDKDGVLRFATTAEVSVRHDVAPGVQHNCGIPSASKQGHVDTSKPAACGLAGVARSKGGWPEYVASSPNLFTRAAARIQPTAGFGREQPGCRVQDAGPALAAAWQPSARVSSRSRHPHRLLPPFLPASLTALAAAAAVAAAAWSDVAREQGASRAAAVAAARQREREANWLRCLAASAPSPNDMSDPSVRFAETWLTGTRERRNSPPLQRPAVAPCILSPGSTTEPV